MQNQRLLVDSIRMEYIDVRTTKMSRSARVKLTARPSASSSSPHSRLLALEGKAAPQGWLVRAGESSYVCEAHRTLGESEGDKWLTFCPPFPATQCLTSTTWAVGPSVACEWSSSTCLPWTEGG